MNLKNILTDFVNDMFNIDQWLVYSSVKSDPDKRQFIILGNTSSVQIDDQLTLWKRHTITKWC